MGKLVDIGAGGVGVETFAPLPEGSRVRVRGELRRAGFDLDLSGSARVSHSTEIFPGLFRAGLQFVEMAYARAS